MLLHDTALLFYTILNFNYIPLYCTMNASVYMYIIWCRPKTSCRRKRCWGVSGKGVRREPLEGPPCPVRGEGVACGQLGTQLGIRWVSGSGRSAGVCSPSSPGRFSELWVALYLSGKGIRRIYIYIYIYIGPASRFLQFRASIR